jgi:DNA-dependent RNA polymerase auxiliary subunit epsilon
MNLVQLRNEAESMYINNVSENRIREFVQEKEDSPNAVKNILNKILGKEVYQLKEGSETFVIFVSNIDVAEDAALTYNAQIINKLR